MIHNRFILHSYDSAASSSMLLFCPLPHKRLGGNASISAESRQSAFHPKAADTRLPERMSAFGQWVIGIECLRLGRLRSVAFLPRAARDPNVGRCRAKRRFPRAAVRSASTPMANFDPNCGHSTFARG
jgi:hypothetical protein